eukprot:TRINITY_DN3843_c0_g1_i15.p2 TRINITY_DN3843_c0_g1~~TRINITY_DN3843_c0_g1_i15.p2  ORF type:complete len:224 (+),score=55.47 TRINITY_DN3843_c0_g1_i15:205-876(+)
MAKKYDCQIFAPSSIAAYGFKSPVADAPEDSALLANCMFGITNVLTEHLGRYYSQRFAVDFRSLRYPGIVTSMQQEYTRITSYATRMFHSARKAKRYTCALREDTRLPFMHVEDIARATVKLLDADELDLTRLVYNLPGLSFTPRELEAEIKKSVPDFICECKPDQRQPIADSWPTSINGNSNKDWGWKYETNISELCKKVFADIDLFEEIEKYLIRHRYDIK